MKFSYRALRVLILQNKNVLLHKNILPKMLISLNKRSLITLYFTFLRPSLVFAQNNMSSGIETADKYSIAYVAVPNMENARTIGRGLVQNKLAACVNIIPQVTSIYNWKGEVNEDNELLLMIKTRTSEVEKLTEFVRTNHPYDICEVISVPIKNGNPPYLNWIGEQVAESGKKN